MAKAKKQGKQTAKNKRSASKAAAKKEALNRIKRGAKEGVLDEKPQAKVNPISPIALILIVLGVAAAYFLAEYLKTM